MRRGGNIHVSVGTVTVAPIGRLCGLKGCEVATLAYNRPWGRAYESCSRSGINGGNHGGTGFIADSAEIPT